MKQEQGNSSNIEKSYNKLTLRFLDKEMKNKFHVANAEVFVKNGRIALIVSILIFVLFSFTDYFIINDIFWQAFIIRVTISLFLGFGSYFLSFFKFFDNFGEGIIGFTVLISGLSILYFIIASSSDLKNYYFFGFYIVVLVSNVFFRQSFVSCLVGSFLFSMAFEYTVFTSLGFSSLSFLNHWYFYSALIMMLVNSYSNELHRINEFSLRQEVEKNNQILTNTNEKLDNLVAKKTNELRTAYINEKKANLLQQTFLKNISHQIRTPLNSIIGISYDILDNEGNGCPNTDIRQINESGKELLRMIDEIVLYSKIEAESLIITKTTFNLTTIIDKVDKYFQEINKREIKLVTNSQPDHDCFIYSDFDKLLTILQNLLYDAYNRTYEGEIELNYSLIDKSGVLFTIIDRGTALENSYITKVLSGSWLEENKNIHSDEFGISLINKLCCYFGDGLKISSSPKHGNNISFSVDTTIECKLHKQESEKNTNHHIIKGITALVVEDISINYTIIKRILEKGGVIVERAVDGLEAVTMTTENEYDIILMDIQMPNMNGIDATKEIRNRGIKVPIIAQTANILAEDKYICLDAGCNDYIGKPINATELIEVIRKQLFAGKV